MSTDLRDLMLDVRDRVIRIETKMESLPALEAKVDKHEAEILKIHTSVKIIRWFSGLLLITIPATAAAVYKAIISS